MRSKLATGGLVAVLAFLLVTNPLVVDAAGQITGKQIKNGSVAGKDLKNGSVKGRDVRDGTLTGADLAPGVLPAVPRVRWALVNRGHTAILAQSGGIAIAATAGSGTFLDFGSSVAGSALSVTPAYLDDDGSTRGNVIATVCGGAPYGSSCAAAGTNDTEHVWVFTQAPANNAGESHAFYVTVIG